MKNYVWAFETSSSSSHGPADALGRPWPADSGTLHAIDYEANEPQGAALCGVRPSGEVSDWDFAGSVGKRKCHACCQLSALKSVEVDDAYNVAVRCPDAAV